MNDGKKNPGGYQIIDFDFVVITGQSNPVPADIIEKVKSNKFIIMNHTPGDGADSIPGIYYQVLGSQDSIQFVHFTIGGTVDYKIEFDPNDGTVIGGE